MVTFRQLSLSVWVNPSHFLMFDLSLSLSQAHKHTHIYTPITAAHSAIYFFPSPVSISHSSTFKLIAQDSARYQANTVPVLTDKLLIDNLELIVLLAHLINTDQFWDQHTLLILSDNFYKRFPWTK